MSQRTFERTARRRHEAQARRETLRRRRVGLAAGAVGAAALLAPAAASADSFQVTNTDNAGAGSLRDQIAAAENTAEDSAITFASNVRGTITLDSGISYDATKGGGLDIQGPGASALSVTAGGSNGILNFYGDGDTPITVTGLTLTGAKNGLGGGILSEGNDLTLNNAVVSGNRAYDGGGVAVLGGEFAAHGTQVVDNHLKFTNGPGAGGGILTSGGDVTIDQGSKIAGNSADNGLGGGIAVGKYGSGLIARGVFGPSDGPVTIEDSTIASNTATLGGGAKFLTGDDVSISRSTVADNVAEGLIGEGLNDRGGPAIAGIGGGVMSFNGGAFTMSASTVSGNRAESPDPSDEVPSRGGPGVIGGGIGGGVVTFSDGDGLVSNSTVSGNSADAVGGIYAGTFGSSLRSAKGLQPLADHAERALRGDPNPDPDPDPGPASSTVAVDNSTVASNSATQEVGGLAIDGFGGPSGAARVAAASTPVGSITSTIVAGNTSVTNPDIDAPTNGSIDSAYSLVQDKGTTTVNTNAAKPTIFGQAAQLGGLTNNGGPTQTMLPATSSPAIDQGIANGLPTDQRQGGFARRVDLSPANAADGTDIGAVEVPAPVVRPITPSAVPTTCGRRIISLVDARVKGRKVVLKGLVGSKLYGKKVTIQADPKGAKASGFSKTLSVSASKTTGTFTATVPKPSKDEYITIRYRAVAGSAKSPALKLPQSLTSKSVRSAKGTITIKGHVKKSLLGKRNRVKIRRLACGRYRTMGSTKPDADGNYTLTFKSTDLRGVALYRAESSVLVRPGSKKYVKQYARAIAIKTTKQTG